MIRVLVGAVALIWVAVGIVASVALARAINIAQSPDRAPLDRREALYVADILAVKQVQS